VLKDVLPIVRFISSSSQPHILAIQTSNQPARVIDTRRKAIIWTQPVSNPKQEVQALFFEENLFFFVVRTPLDEATAKALNVDKLNVEPMTLQIWRIPEQESAHQSFELVLTHSFDLKLRMCIGDRSFVCRKISHDTALLLLHVFQQGSASRWQAFEISGNGTTIRHLYTIHATFDVLRLSDRTKHEMYAWDFKAAGPSSAVVYKVYNLLNGQVLNQAEFRSSKMMTHTHEHEASGKCGYIVSYHPQGGEHVYIWQVFGSKPHQRKIRYNGSGFEAQSRLLTIGGESSLEFFMQVGRIVVLEITYPDDLFVPQLTLFSVQF
jgi:hypothetical protein